VYCDPFTFDILLEEKGDFEWDKKIGAGAFAALATKGGVAAKLKGGVVTIAILTAFEIGMDPEATGKTVANLLNFFQGINDLLQDGIFWLIDTWEGRPKWLGGTGKGFAEMPTSFKEWGRDFEKGFQSELNSLMEEGKLTRSLQPFGSNLQPSGNFDFQDYLNSNGQPQIFPGRAVGGNIGTTGPYLLHQGERVISKQQNGNASINVTYNVTVSDKREFESMLERNNRQLTADVRRLVG